MLVFREKNFPRDPVLFLCSIAEKLEKDIRCKSPLSILLTNIECESNFTSSLGPVPCDLRGPGGGAPFS